MKPETVEFLRSRLNGSRRNQFCYAGIGLCWLLYGLIQMVGSVARHKSLSDPTPLLWAVVAMLFVIQAINESTFQNLCAAALAGIDRSEAKGTDTP
jgi:hypothetical protein